MISVLAVLLQLAPVPVFKVGHLAVPAPYGYVVEQRRGLDYSQYYIHPRLASKPVLQVYLGGFPGTVAPKKGVHHVPFLLGLRQTHWALWQTAASGSKEWHAEAIVDAPFGIESVQQPPRVGLLITAGSELDLQRLQSVAAGIRPASAER